MTNIIDTSDDQSISYQYQDKLEHTISFSSNLSGLALTGKSGNSVAVQFVKIKRLGQNFKKYLNRCFSNLDAETIDFSDTEPAPMLDVELGQETFADCANLKTVYISKNQNAFSEKMFMNDAQLSCVSPKEYLYINPTLQTYSLTKIEAKFLYRCQNLKYMAIPQSISNPYSISPIALQDSSIVKISFPGAVSQSEKQAVAYSIQQTECFGLQSDCEIILGCGSDQKIYVYSQTEKTCVEAEDQTNGYYDYVVSTVGTENPYMDRLYWYNDGMIEKCNNENIAYCVIESNNCFSSSGMKFVSEILQNDIEDTLSNAGMLFFIWDGTTCAADHIKTNVVDDGGKTYPRMVFKYKDAVESFQVEGMSKTEIKELIKQEYEKFASNGWDKSSYTEPQQAAPDLDAEGIDDNTPAFVICARGDDKLVHQYYDVDVIQDIIKQKWPGGINKNNIVCLSNNTDRIKQGLELEATDTNFIAAINKYKNHKNLIIVYSDHGISGSICTSPNKVSSARLYEAIKDREWTFLILACCFAESMVPSDPLNGKTLFWCACPAKYVSYSESGPELKEVPPYESRHAHQMIYHLYKTYTTDYTYQYIWEILKTCSINAALFKKYSWKKKKNIYGPTLKNMIVKHNFNEFDESQIFFN